MKPKIEFSAHVDEATQQRVVEVQEAEDARRGVLVNGPTTSKPLRAQNAVTEHANRTKPAPPIGVRSQSVETAVDWWSRPREE
jgi:hypothetical protein